MKINEFCPYCDEIVEFEFTDEYYFIPEGDEVEQCVCPMCFKKISISWESTHDFHADKVSDKKGV